MSGRPPADWQLPEGVNRGLWDYLHDPAIARNYDAGPFEVGLGYRGDRLGGEDRFPGADRPPPPGRLGRHAPGDAVQPAGDVLGSDRPGPAGEHEKRRLEGVLGEVVVHEDAAAGAQDEPAVPPDRLHHARVPLRHLQRRERGAVRDQRGLSAERRQPGHLRRASLRGRRQRRRSVRHVF